MGIIRVESLLKQMGKAWGGTLNRRDFLRCSVQGAFFLTAASAGVVTPGRLHAAQTPDVAITVGDPAAAVREALNLLGGIKAFVKPGEKVVIKPNMSFDGPVANATSTHPEVVRQLVSLCREAGASRVRVLDHTLRPSEECLQGVREACRIFGNDIVHALDKEEFYREVAISKGASLRQTEVMKDVLDSEVLIAAPVAKAHGSTGVSLSMKGMMGLVLNRSVMHWRYNLHDSIVDLCTILRPRLVVVDATRVLTTNGPGGPGKVITPRTVIASRDMVAADATAVAMFEWYGKKMEPRQVKHIRLAHERGIGRMDIANLNTRRVVL